MPGDIPWPMKLLRAHGLGNDYLVLEDGGPVTAGMVRAICDRHTGVGSDGLLEPREPSNADYGVRIWNPDGSVAEKSGNGLRIFARWLHETRGAPQRFSIWTGHDLVRCVVHPDTITVAMGQARCSPVTLSVDGTTLEAIVVDLGNPHCVVFCTEALDTLPWRRWGAALEVHAHFPARTNVQFVRIHSPRELHARIWERGAGETQASGSSSCAVVAAAVHTGQIEVGTAEVVMPGGQLIVTVDAQLQVILEGPVELVARIELLPSFAARVQNERE